MSTMYATDPKNQVCIAEIYTASGKLDFICVGFWLSMA